MKIKTFYIYDQRQQDDVNSFMESVDVKTTHFQEIKNGGKVEGLQLNVIYEEKPRKVLTPRMVDRIGDKIGLIGAVVPDKDIDPKMLPEKIKSFGYEYVTKHRTNKGDIHIYKKNDLYILVTVEEFGVFYHMDRSVFTETSLGGGPVCEAIKEVQEFLHEKHLEQYYKNGKGKVVTQKEKPTCLEDLGYANVTTNKDGLREVVYRKDHVDIRISDKFLVKINNDPDMGINNETWTPDESRIAKEIQENLIKDKKEVKEMIEEIGDIFQRLEEKPNTPKKFKVGGKVLFRGETYYLSSKLWFKGNLLYVIVKNKEDVGARYGDLRNKYIWEDMFKRVPETELKLKPESLEELGYEWMGALDSLRAPYSVGEDKVLVYEKDNAIIYIHRDVITKKKQSHKGALGRKMTDWFTPEEKDLAFKTQKDYFVLGKDIK